ncbi:BREX-2 system adenine-specific DNA-methyltransferase PglX [Streptomyces lancefieldiae]|uniref:site-specific DNA-methyltransferase (adenine-specific) n=1 Tax=Streptomyces lancefieldiae TaxID=3075520 RepID=A0ABU3ASX0_9ACTN|nr:BREX-2 system adenine-specific DNA-methyltransferase PglX [Streptomyces sp. DSM 40712]MDT0613285.1 BREX-2 system adenine-specific DNA-methyltransferase PglX [Streptomyces sp. DSM 40712]
MPADHGLFEDLRRLIARIEADLHARLPMTPTAERLRAEYDRARFQRTTSATWHTWLDVQVSQSARAWVLATVMIRFCEDNGLLDPSFAGDAAHAPRARHDAQFPTRANHLLIDAVDRLRSHPAMAMVLGEPGHAHWQLRPGDEACEELISFWQHRRSPDGTFLHDLTDGTRSTEFLAGLHSVIDEDARKTHGQVTTPHFVVRLINDLVLDPALTEHAAAPAGLSGFRIIDPACGTGAFLLDAYERLFQRWSETRPAMSPWQRAARALKSIHGSDIDPCAASITRFRLLLAAMNSTGERRLDNVPDLPLVVATTDALLDARRDPRPRTTPTDRRPDAHADRHGLLRPASYHAVITNPPYITVKDKALSAAYRVRYASCNGAYPLSAPFTELAFSLALPGETAGRVGMLTSNSFMKREFGRGLIERVLSKVEISHVIDTSGAYIPGHGTPTVLLVGRNHVPGPHDSVHVIVSRRGEPAMPQVPSEGLVWRALRDHALQAGGTSDWAESYQQDREELNAFPWSLAPSAVRTVLRHMEEGERLGERVVRIGYAANTGSDDLFTGSAQVFQRAGAEESATVPVLTGSEVRDWSAQPALTAFFPRTKDVRETIDLRQFPGHHRRLWPYRTVLRKRSGMKKAAPWYDWHHIATDWDTHPWSIVFPWVATHPHFSLLRDPAVPLNSAPSIRLPPSETEESHLGLLGVLNSSAVCFWLKQMSQSKGQPRIGQLRGGEAWEKIYEFTSTRLLELPLPPAFPIAEAEELDRLARESSGVLQKIADPNVRITAQLLATAQQQWSSVKARMIAVQEELDWKVYGLFGLIRPDEELNAAPEDVPDVALGERAFEIALARRAAAGEVQTTWFDRHRTIPSVEVPEQWPWAYRSVVNRRIATIRESVTLSLLEQPEYKRRWFSQPWDLMVGGILRARLLDHCEAARLWYENPSERRSPTTRTIRELAQLLRHDEEFTEMVELYAPSTSVTDVLVQLLADEHVPQAPPLRYKASGLNKRRLWEDLWEAQRQEDTRRDVAPHAHSPDLPHFTSSDFHKPSYWKLRGKFDMPSERFVSFGPTISPLSPTSVIGWAGWNARERAVAVLDLLEAESHAHVLRPESAPPLLSALAEVLPWISTPCDEPAPGPSAEQEALRRAYEAWLARLGLSTDDVDSWRPPAPRRGRPRKNI